MSLFWPPKKDDIVTNFGKISFSVVFGLFWAFSPCDKGEIYNARLNRKQWSNKKVEENKSAFKFNFTMEFKCPERILNSFESQRALLPNPLTAPFFSKFLGRILSCPDNRKISGRQISVTTSPFNKQLSRVPGKIEQYLFLSQADCSGWHQIAPSFLHPHPSPTWDQPMVGLKARSALFYFLKYWIRVTLF